MDGAGWHKSGALHIPENLSILLPSDTVALFDGACLDGASAARDHIVLRPLALSPLRQSTS